MLLNIFVGVVFAIYNIIFAWCALLITAYFHEKSHFYTAYNIRPTSGIIKINTKLLKINKEKKLDKDNTLIIKSSKSLDGIGITFLSNNYTLYVDQEIIKIAKAGNKNRNFRLFFLIITYSIIFLIIAFNNIKYCTDFLISVIISCALIIMWFIVTVKKNKMYIRSQRQINVKVWTDTEIEESPDEFVNYMKSLPDNSSKLYKNNL